MYPVLDLFSGIGGFSLGLRSASDAFYTSAFCEIDLYCQAVLKKHFKDVPVFEDIRELNEKKLKKVQAAEPFIITGGYPCQPFSTAGKRKGEGDPRHLWPEMLRLVKELKPKYVLAENVHGHVRMGLDDVLNDLENENYTTGTFVIPATGVGANHQRKRVWIIAYTGSFNKGSAAQSEQSSNNIGGRRSRTHSRSKEEMSSDVADSKLEGLEGLSEQGATISRQNKRTQFRNESSGADVADSNSKRFQEQRRSKSVQETGKKSKCESGYGRGNWDFEPNVGRVVDGLPFRVDRLKAIGNSIVPQIAEIIGKAIITQEEE